MPMQRTKYPFTEWWLKKRDSVTVKDQRDDGGVKLSKQAVLLLVVNGLFAVANALSGTYVNVYLWKVSNDLLLIGWFAVAGQIANVLTFFIAGKWVREYNKMNSLRLGVALSACFYLFVLWLQQKAVDYVLLLGAIQGMAGGFFWLSFNVVYFEVTGPDNRDRFNGWAGLLGSLAGMTAPWVSGFLITRMQDTAGYRLIFGISLCVFVIAAVLSFFLKKRKVKGQYEWLHGFHKLKESGNPWRNTFPALAAQGVREGVFAFIIGLLVYIATKNEMKVGNYSLITSAVALVGFWMTGKFLTPRWRSRAMLIGLVAMIAVILPFFWKLNYGTLLLFGIGTALFFPLFSLPMTSSVFDLIGKDQASADLRVEYVVLREVGLNAGRLFGTVVFMIVVSWSRNAQVLNALLLFIGSFPIIAWWFMRPLLRGS